MSELKPTSETNDNNISLNTPQNNPDTIILQNLMSSVKLENGNTAIKPLMTELYDVIIENKERTSLESPSPLHKNEAQLKSSSDVQSSVTIAEMLQGVKDYSREKFYSNNAAIAPTKEVIAVFTKEFI